MKAWRAGFCAVLFAVAGRSAEPVLLVDFAQAGHGWKGNPRTRDARQDLGFSVELTGQEDPWLEGPPVALPGFGEAQKLVLLLEAEVPQSGAFQLFYAPQGKGFSEDATVRMSLSPDAPGTYTGVIPLAAERLRFRLDPPGSIGRVRLRSLKALPLIPLATLSFAKPEAVSLSGRTVEVESGAVRIAHHPGRWNAFACFVGGRRMAESNPSEPIVYMQGKRTVSLPLAAAETSADAIPGGIEVRAKLRDEEGAVWQLDRTFSADRGGVRVVTSVRVDAPRVVVHLPWLTLFCGTGSFGPAKSQALLPGVEYLDDEPSSNEKEIRGPAANRRLVERYKVCYPMMALAAGGQWLSVAWRPETVPVSPLFDSPDRVFGSGGHVLGVWSPAVGEARFESEFTVYDGVRLGAGQAVSCSATVCGGAGDVVTEAVGRYVAREGLPDLPRFEKGFEDAVRLLASGWLDSAARQGDTWRHAVWGDHFPAAVAEDVPGYLLWLASQTPDAALKARLAEAAGAAIARLPAGSFGVNGISHVKRPAGALVYGNLDGAVRQAGPHAKRLAQQLADGHARYRPGEKADYASTLGRDTCNGFTALSAEEMLGQATLTGDETAIDAALAVLDKMTAHYAGQVPRGAQPWEMPLHTPDIVASARLVRCYVMGYQLSGRASYLEQARYWAWTGVTMLYLAPPVPGPVGVYATIGVIGATNWEAPNWIGQPVQWCGLVYRSALEDLAKLDGEQRETWQRLAHGITITGLQMCFPIGDKDGRGGLLPDYFLLKQQLRDGPAINPGTLQAHLAEAYGKTPMYTALRLSNGSLVHVPGDVRQEAAAVGSLQLTVNAWPEGAYRVLITRADAAPAKVLWNGDAVAPQYVDAARAWFVTLRGSGRLVY